MDLFGVLLLNIGAFCIAVATECVPETSKCSKYWEKILPHKNLIATESELNSWCSKQDRFYECLQDVFLEGRNGNLSYLPTNLLISKLYARDLCTEGSKSRSRLLENADCINKLNTDICVLPEYLEIVTADDDIPSTKCSQAEKTFSCIAATIVLNCGIPAGWVYRNLLRITRYSDEVCGIEISDGVPRCEGSRIKTEADRDKKLSEIYYGLFHRIGDVLDQDEKIAQPISEEELPEHTDVVTEAIQNAIDSLDENLVLEELETPEHLDLKHVSPIPCSKDTKNFKPHMSNPIITEVRGLLFYNYSDKEYALYWRRPDFTVVDKAVCENLVASWVNFQLFWCITNYRYTDPNCVSNVSRYEKITPELIRSLDPEIPCDSKVELGPKPEWMKEIDRLYEEKIFNEEMKSTVSEAVTEASTISTTIASLAYLTATTYAPIDIEKWHEYEFGKGNNLNSIFPKDLVNEFTEVLKQDLKNFQPPQSDWFKTGSTMYQAYYNFNFSQLMENVTCSRIDECHPEGRGLWKCKIYPRKIEVCDDACRRIALQKFFPSGGDVVFAKPSNESMTPDTTEPTETVSLGPTPAESVPLEFSGDAEVEKPPEDHSGEEAGIINQILMKDEPDSDDELEDSDKVEYSLLSDTDELQILANLFDKDEDSPSSEVVYAIEDSDAEDGESDVILATEDGLLAGNIIFVKNISDLDNTKYTVISAPTDD